MSERGYCAASRQPEVVARAAPWQTSGSIDPLNVSVSSGETIAQVAAALSKPLLDPPQEIFAAIARRQDVERARRSGA